MNWILLLPLLLVLPFLGSFLCPSDSGYSDLLISHYPNALAIHNSLFQNGVIPLWSDRILSGFPLAANPLSGLWYPFGWLTILWPAAWAFNLTLACHLVFGGLGMYRWLKTEGLGAQAALTGALAFELVPKLWGHLASGHVTLVYAFAWTPWLLLAARTAAKKMHWSAQPALIMGLLILADVRWAALAGVLWAAYAICTPRILVARTDTQDKQAVQRNTTLIQQVSGAVLRILLQAVASVLAAAVLAIPLLEFTNLSTRSQLGAGDIFTLSLPFSKMAGILFPDWGGNAEWIVYPGGVVLMLAIVAASRAANQPASVFWGISALASLMLSLGSNLPGLSFFGRLPLVNLLRVPPRALLIFAFSLVVLAAYAINGFSRVVPATSQRKSLLLAAVQLELAILVAVALYISAGEIGINVIWGVFLPALVLTGFIFFKRGVFSPRVLWIGITILIVLDGSIHAVKSFQPRSSEVVLAEGAAAAEFIASAPGNLRVYSPSYSIPQQTAAYYGLKLADGVDPLQLLSYAGFMQAASGVPPQGYTITLPPFRTATPAVDNRLYLPDADLLGILNVGYVVSAYDLNSPGLSLVGTFNETRVYINEAQLDRARVVPPPGADETVPSGVSMISEDANQQILEASGPGTLVVSEIAYPGWRVEIDGRPAQAITWEGLLRAVVLPEGKHTVRWVFRSQVVLAGMSISLFTWLALLGYETWQRRRA